MKKEGEIAKSFREKQIGYLTSLRKTGRRDPLPRDDPDFGPKKLGTTFDEKVEQVTFDTTQPSSQLYRSYKAAAADDNDDLVPGLKPYPSSPQRVDTKTKSGASNTNSGVQRHTEESLKPIKMPGLTELARELRKILGKTSPFSKKTKGPLKEHIIKYSAIAAGLGSPLPTSPNRTGPPDQVPSPPTSPTDSDRSDATIP